MRPAQAVGLTRVRPDEPPYCRHDRRGPTGTAGRSPARFDARLADSVRVLIGPWRGEIGRYVADVVRGWEAETVTARLERAVGRDLQYIRINGTLVGCLVGCALFLIVAAFA